METPNRIYLDHAATSPLAPEAREAMARYLDCGNPSSLYAEGRLAKQALDVARESLSARLRCEFAEVAFTSGGTESAAMAIIGYALASRMGKRRRVLLGAAEHHCVLNTRETLEALGFEVGTIPVDRNARINLEALRDLLDENVLLVSAMHANNELGTINPVVEIAAVTHHVGAVLHCDAVQTFCKLDWTVGDLKADLVSISGHKIGGPKGVGALYVHAGVELKPLIAGGGQERELRAGTENVAAIGGFGAAVEASRSGQGVSGVRDRLRSRLIELGAVSTLAPSVDSLPGHSHVRFPGVPADTLLIALDMLGVAVGSGAACSSGSIEPSHVLLACGYSLAEAKEGIRFTLGTETTLDEVEEAAARVGKALERLNSKTPSKSLGRKTTAGAIAKQ